MGDVKGNKVEKYKLTPGQVDFQKRFKNLQQMRILLEAATLQKKTEFKNLQEMWKSLEGQYQMLQQSAPGEATHELSGMSFPPDMRIKY